MTRLLQYCADQWVGFWSPQAVPSNQPPADISYDEVSPQQISRMNEHARDKFAKGNWVTETLET
ncbi:MAG TPA: hypothetical protein VHX86_02025 [Tepidisphaeraceae bacterium]|jgi:hypothetical protein|nr:hypothetical protein [Tepidisphaeraceae bacterium]